MGNEDNDSETPVNVSEEKDTKLAIKAFDGDFHDDFESNEDDLHEHELK